MILRAFALGIARLAAAVPQVLALMAQSIPRNWIDDIRRLPVQIVLSAVLVCVAAAVQSTEGRTQEIDFSKIDKFESLSSGTLRVGSPPKTIIEDDERHVVVLTIWDADAETKVYWRSPDGNAPRTTVIPGRGVQTFQTVGEFKLEAVGEPNREVQYGYVLLGLQK
jgi:hypothetical protein